MTARKETSEGDTIVEANASVRLLTTKTSQLSTKRQLTGVNSSNLAKQEQVTRVSATHRGE
jgi:hypothetical protein